MIIKVQLSALAREINKDRQPLAIALGMLLRAHQYAQDINVDRWEFAIPFGEFRYAGVTISELKWLLWRGIAVHARLVFQEDCGHRRYTPLGIQSLPPDACFVLSDQGVQFLKAHISYQEKPGALHPNRRRPSAILQGASTRELFADASSIPYWDQDKRELTFQGVIVKAFRSTAPNQEKILTAFQEEGWSRRIDDPLPPHFEQDSRERLRSAIKQLNRYQDNSILRFCGDGSGTGVLWQGLA